MTITDPNQFDSIAADDGVVALERIIREAAADTVTEISDDIATVLTPAGVARHLIDLQRFASAPARPVGTVQVHNPESFAAVAGDHQTEDTCLYVNVPAQRLTAIVNDDRADGRAGWRDRRVELVLQQTPEWVFWTSHQGLGEQQKFAETIEDGLAEIVTPSAADMLELAQSFQASISSTFKQAGRLTDGRTQFAFSEDIDAKAGSTGTLELPGEFKIRLSVYLDSPEVDLTARLRYRINGGHLTIGYMLVHPERAVTEAFLTAVTASIEAMTDPVVVQGQAPEPAKPIAADVVNVSR